MSERIHPVAVEGHDLTALAVEIGRLRYDALAIFLNALANELKRQSVADQDRGRITLAHLLNSASDEMTGACDRVERAFKLSAPHMREELAQTPSLLP